MLIVMNLRGEPVKKNLLMTGKGFRLAGKLCTNDENITYRSSRLTLPAYSIAVFVHK